MSKRELFYISHLYKQRGRENVLCGIDLRLYEGEIVLLLGREGSGKTTLSEILAGHIQPDLGAVIREGRRIVLHGRHTANQNGIHLIHEESGLFDNLSLGENICIRNPVGFGLCNYVAKVEASAAILCDELGIAIDPHALPREQQLSLLDRIFIELARAVYQRARLIILDNLLWLLSEEECHRLFDLLAVLRERGITSLVCAADPGSVRARVDRIVFLRAGAVAADYDQISWNEAAVRQLLDRPTALPNSPTAPLDEEQEDGRAFCFETADGRPVRLELAPGDCVGLCCPNMRQYRPLLERLSDENWLNYRNQTGGWNRGMDDICCISLDNLYHDCFLHLSVAENVILAARRDVGAAARISIRRTDSFLREEICPMLSIDRSRWKEPAYHCTWSERAELVLYRALARSRHLIVLAGVLDEPNAARRADLSRFMRDASVRRKSIVLLAQNETLLRNHCDRVFYV